MLNLPPTERFGNDTTDDTDELRLLCKGGVTRAFVRVAFYTFGGGGGGWGRGKGGGTSTDSDSMPRMPYVRHGVCSPTHRVLLMTMRSTPSNHRLFDCSTCRPNTPPRP